MRTSDWDYIGLAQCWIQKEKVSRGIFRQSLTFDALLLLTLSEEVDYIFWVSHTVHKLLTEARGVERFKTSTVVHLETRTRGIHLLVERCRNDESRTQLTLSRIKGFSGVSGQPSLSLSASSNISDTCIWTRRNRLTETDKVKS